MLCSLITFIVVIVAIIIILDHFSIINYSRPRTEGFLSSDFPKNSFDKTNKMNLYRSSVDPYDNNFYANTSGFINPMDKLQYGNHSLKHKKE